MTAPAVWLAAFYCLMPDGMADWPRRSELEFDSIRMCEAARADPGIRDWAARSCLAEGGLPYGSGCVRIAPAEEDA